MRGLAALVALATVVVATAGAETRVSLYVNARGFVSAGVAVEHDLQASATGSLHAAARGALELPVAFDTASAGVPAGRIAVGLSTFWTGGSLRIGARPDVVFVWHAQELGRFRTISFAVDGTVGAVASSGSWIGGLVGLEYGFLTHYTPSELVERPFEGLDQSPPAPGWYANTAFNTRVGIAAAATGQSVSVVGSAGLRLQPCSVAPLFSGFPYGNLPFFFEVELSFAPGA